MPSPTPMPKVMEAGFLFVVAGIVAVGKEFVREGVFRGAVDAVTLVVVGGVEDSAITLVAAADDDVVVSVRSAWSTHHLDSSVLTGRAAMSLSVELSSNATYGGSLMMFSHVVSHSFWSPGSQLPSAQSVRPPQLSGWWHIHIFFGVALKPLQKTRPTQGLISVSRLHLEGQCESCKVESVQPYWYVTPNSGL